MTAELQQDEAAGAADGHGSVGAGVEEDGVGRATGGIRGPRGQGAGPGRERERGAGLRGWERGAAWARGLRGRGCGWGRGRRLESFPGAGRRREDFFFFLNL